MISFASSPNSVRMLERNATGASQESQKNDFGYVAESPFCGLFSFFATRRWGFRNNLFLISRRQLLTMLSGNLGSARFESVPADTCSIVGVDCATKGDADIFFSKAVIKPKVNNMLEGGRVGEGGGGEGVQRVTWDKKCSP